MLFFILLFAFWAYPVVSVVTIAINRQVFAESTAIATWHRDPTDPIPHSVFKVKEDERNTTSGERISLQSDPIHLKLNNSSHASHLTNVTDANILSGNISIPFNRAGIFHLIVKDKDGHKLADSPQFGVNAPVKFQVDIESNGQPSPPIVSSIPSAVNSTSDPQESKKSKGGKGGDNHGKHGMSSGLIAAVVLVSVVLLACLAAILYYFIRKRLLRQRYLKERREIEAKFSPFMMSRGNGSPPSSAPLSPNNAGYRNRGTGAGFSDTQSVRRFSIFSGSQFAESLANITTSEDGQRRRRSFPSIITSDTGDVSTIRFNPQTERQIALEERIWELETAMDIIRSELKEANPNAISSDDLRLWKLKGQIESLRSFKESQWALGFTDEVPAGLSFR